MDPLPRYRARASAIFAELGDGSGVLLDLQTKAYFTLNTTGVFVWKYLAAGELDADTAADRLSAEFAVDKDRARADVAGLLRDLHAQELVETLVR